MNLIAGVFLLLLLLLQPSMMGVESIPTPTLTVPPLDASHAILAQVLGAVVKADGVDYAAVQRLQPELDRYRAQLAQAPAPKGRAEILALYINAYNALTLSLVASKLPVDQQQWPAWSITLIGPPMGSAWKGFDFEVAGQRHTLDAIEHAILRPLKEPRIHVAINCASRSCPALAAEPFIAARLEAQLTAVGARFARDPYHVRINAGQLRLNPIFEWFGDDFAAVGGPRATLLAWAPDSPATLSTTPDLHFFAYDWRLNLTGVAP